MSVAGLHGFIVFNQFCFFSCPVCVDMQIMHTCET